MHVTNVVVLKCWNKPNIRSRVASTLAILTLRDEVTRVIIVLFVGGHVTNVQSKTSRSPPTFHVTKM